MSRTVAKTIPLRQIEIKDHFWTTYTNLVRETVIPYQWDALNDQIPDAEPSHAIRNFRIAAGLEEGEFNGFVFQDSDLAKWLEAVGYSLSTHPDPSLERCADEMIDIIVQAQSEDGYLNTYFTIKEPGKRWANLHECHELYCAGHMIEAAVAYYQATGKRKFLDAMCRFADHIESTFGTEPGKINGYCGHQEIELALVKLYQTTGNEKYLHLSRYFIEERGNKPNYFIEEWKQRGQMTHWVKGKGPAPNLEYSQSHLPVREQSIAVGHAVRAVYMYTAMADLARLTGDQDLLTACRRLWNNITTKQMYITGGIGSTHHGEAFSFDYDLPNDTVYAETCASIGLIFFAQRMLQLEVKREYADVLERALYNLVIGSMSTDGKHYFYVNPLEVWPEASKKNPGKRHIKAERQKWFGCSCCPPNVARLLASLGQYVYTVEDQTIYTHLFIGSKLTVNLGNDTVTIVQESDLPWHGNIKLHVSLEKSKRFALALRVPGWCSGEARYKLNGREDSCESCMQDGYVVIDREWSDADLLELDLPMEAEWMHAHPEIRANAGKVALQRGPLVYCLEEVDNGHPINSISVSTGSKLRTEFDPDFLGGAMVIKIEGWKDEVPDWNQQQIYRPAKKQHQSIAVQAVPYYLWGNRGIGEMTVWVRTK